jgi:hypothetical protein
MISYNLSHLNHLTQKGVQIPKMNKNLPLDRKKYLLGILFINI